MTATTVGGLGSVDNVETVNVDLGDGNDTMTVSGLLGEATAIHLDGGNDTDTLDVSSLSTTGAGNGVAHARSLRERGDGR